MDLRTRETSLFEPRDRPPPGDPRTVAPPPHTPVPPSDGDDGPNGDDPPHRPGSSLSNANLAMLMLLGAETMLFAVLLAAFFVLRAASPVWPPANLPRLPLLITGMNTLVLLYSAVTMRSALRAMRRWESRKGARLLLLTIVLGSAFLAIQGYEWIQLVRYGLTLAAGVYGASFYILIGSHGVHVLGAVIWLGVITLRAFQQDEITIRPLGVAVCGMYWYYVVALWPVLFILVYLI